MLCPRWDGQRLMFDIHDAKDHVHCAISRAALLDIAEHIHLRPSELIACFIEFRSRIESIAWAKFRSRPDRPTRRVNIWSDDIDPPPASAPVAARAGEVRRSALAA